MSRITIQQALEIAVAHHQSGRLAQATDIYDAILAAEPNQPAALHMLGVAVHEEGDFSRARSLIAKAIALQPGIAEMHGNLGLVLQDLGRLDDAIAVFEVALSLDPDFAAAHCNLGGVLRQHGQINEALASCRRAILLAPDIETFWIGFGACVQTMAFDAVDDALLDDLLALLERPWVDPPALAPAMLSALRHQRDIARLLTGPVHAPDAAVLSAIPLLLRLMALSPLKDLAMEALFTAARRAMLRALDAGQWDDCWLPFAVALAQHCFVNEYVFHQTPEEDAQVARLERTTVSPAQLAMLGAYTPLHRFAWSADLPNKKRSADLAGLLTRQITEPLAEQELCRTLPRLSAIGGGISKAVRDQYEANPYPRWVRFGAQGMAASIAAVLGGSPLDLPMDGYESPSAPDILIAGCGTGLQSLLCADRFANARILAIDLSLASLAYAARMTGELGIVNIEFAQADIMAMADFERRFDLIECVGVLHHLADPERGWRILTGLLRPGGVMKIGLYSEAARRDVVAGRALIAAHGYAPSPSGIRRCRQDIAARAHDGDPAMARLTQRDSFFSASECRDLLFHVQEHRFTLPRIEAALAALKLEFLGFEFPGPPPRAPASLADWHRFEAAHPDTFTGMYEFWVRKP